MSVWAATSGRAGILHDPAGSCAWRCCSQQWPLLHRQMVVASLPWRRAWRKELNHSKREMCAARPWCLDLNFPSDTRGISKTALSLTRSLSCVILFFCKVCLWSLLILQPTNTPPALKISLCIVGSMLRRISGAVYPGCPSWIGKRFKSLSRIDRLKSDNTGLISCTKSTMTGNDAQIVDVDASFWIKFYHDDNAHQKLIGCLLHGISHL